MRYSTRSHFYSKEIFKSVSVLLSLIVLSVFSVFQPTMIQARATQASQSTSASSSTHPPTLAFYYGWYNPSDWCSCHMSDLPTIKYRSSDDQTIERQLDEAANAGITGFIASWWGVNSPTDHVFTKLLQHSAALQQRTGQHFTSTLYFESDAPALQGKSTIIQQLRSAISTYGNSPNFFHWHGKPVLFFWDPLGNGRTLNEWSAIRHAVDPNHQQIWSAEGVNTTLLSVFDGLHLFSGGYWGLQHGNMPQVDQGFRAKINAYNNSHGTHKIWAAGIIPGYDDTRVPGRQGTYKIPRNGGSTYRTSWKAALSSNPDWVTITSFNEWFEGSMIEPSVTYHNLYLQITHDFTHG